MLYDAIASWVQAYPNIVLCSFLFALLLVLEQLLHTKILYILTILATLLVVVLNLIHYETQSIFASISIFFCFILFRQNDIKETRTYLFFFCSVVHFFPATPPHHLLMMDQIYFFLFLIPLFSLKNQLPSPSLFSFLIGPLCANWILFSLWMNILDVDAKWQAHLLFLAFLLRMGVFNLKHTLSILGHFNPAFTYIYFAALGQMWWLWGQAHFHIWHYTALIGIGAVGTLFLFFQPKKPALLVYIFHCFFMMWVGVWMALNLREEAYVLAELELLGLPFLIAFAFRKNAPYAAPIHATASSLRLWKWFTPTEQKSYWLYEIQLLLDFIFIMLPSAFYFLMRFLLSFLYNGSIQRIVVLWLLTLFSFLKWS